MDAEGNGNPLKYPCLGNPMDRGAWRATIHGVTRESDTIWQLNINSILMYNKNKMSAQKRNGISTLTEMVYAHPSQSISKTLIKDKVEKNTNFSSAGISKKACEPVKIRSQRINGQQMTKTQGRTQYHCLGVFGKNKKNLNLKQSWKCHFCKFQSIQTSHILCS